MNYYLAVFKKFAVFNGRAQRAEYWYFYLFNMIIAFVLGMVSYKVGDTKGMLGNLFMLVLLIPGLAVTIRRLHDTGKSGWWILTGIIPLWLLVYLVMDSTPGENKYGPNPKGAMAN